MKYLLTICLLLCSFSIQAQDVTSPGPILITPNNDNQGNDGITTIEVKPGVTGFRLNYDKTVTFFGTRVTVGSTAEANSSRLELTTQSAHVADFSSVTYDTGTYKNNTFRLGYNSDPAGAKLNSGEVNFALQFEPKFLTGSGYQTEIYFKWCNAAGTICTRPWGMNLLDTTGEVIGAMRGRWVFVDNSENPTAIWLNEGFLDFITPQAGIRFPNNASAIRAYNAAHTGDLTLIKLDDQDRVVISAEGSPIVLGGPMVDIHYTGKIFRNNVEVLGNQCAPIADSEGGVVDDRRAVNQVIKCLVDNGIIAAQP